MSGKQFHESETSRRANGVWERPEKVFIPGLDVDPKLGRPHKRGEHPLWQDPDEPGRVLREGDPDMEKLILSIGAKGVINPALIDKDDQDRTCVSNGKRRTFAARCVNKRRAAAGDPPIEMLFVPSRAQGSKSFSASQAKTVMALSNEHAITNNQMTRILAAADMRERSIPPSEICAIYGITLDHLEAVWLPLASATPDVQKLVADRTVTLTEAAKLMKLPMAKRAESVAKIAEVVAEVEAIEVPDEPKKGRKNGKGRDKAAKVQRDKVKAAMGQKVVPPKKEQRRAFEYVGVQYKEAKPGTLKIQFEAAKETMAWVLGEGPMPKFLSEEE